jgi:hypothetical protein
MSEYHPPDDSLEHRLHSLYDVRFGPPPAADHVRRQVARLIAQHQRSDSFKGDTAMQPSSPPITSQKRLHPRLAWLGSAVAVVLIAALTLAVFRAFRPGSSHSTPVTHVTPPAATPTPVSLDPNNSTVLGSVSMTSVTEGWAVGSYWHYDSKTQQNTGEKYALFEHYQNGTWTPSIADLGVQGKDGESDGLQSVSMDSPTDGWATGGISGTPPRGLLFHYDGHTWTSKPVPAGVGVLTFVQMLSSTDGWAVSGTIPGMILHYDGTSWQIVAQEHIRQAFAFNGLSMISSAEGWAAGNAFDNPHPGANNGAHYFPTYGIILHYQNGAWTQDASFPNFVANSLSMLPNGDGWVVGTTFPQETFSSGIAAIYYHHNGHWTQQPFVTTDMHATGVVVDAANGWLGTSVSGSPIYHLSGQSWQPFPTPNIQDSLIPTITGFSFPSTGEGWAVGEYLSTTNSSPLLKMLIFHFQNGAWSIRS